MATRGGTYAGVLYENLVPKTNDPVTDWAIGDNIIIDSSANWTVDLAANDEVVDGKIVGVHANLAGTVTKLTCLMFYNRRIESACTTDATIPVVGSPVRATGTGGTVEIDAGGTAQNKCIAVGVPSTGYCIYYQR
jgi:hypothetical protein